jgi:quinol monooxygenase YgiN
MARSLPATLFGRKHQQWKQYAAAGCRRGPRTCAIAQIRAFLARARNRAGQRLDSRTGVGVGFAFMDEEIDVVVVRFKVRCQPEKSAEMAAAMKAVVEAARRLDGVIHFDIARDLTDADALIATEVFEDRAAMEREESIPEVAQVVELMQAGALAGSPEWTIFEVASSESPQM